MEFEGFDWDSGNRLKCQKHGLSLADIEETFSRKILLLDDPFDASVERRFRVIGTAADGRRVFVVFALRGGCIRPLSARYMHRKEVDRYEKDNPNVQDR